MGFILEKSVKILVTYWKRWLGGLVARTPQSSKKGIQGSRGHPLWITMERVSVWLSRLLKGLWLSFLIYAERMGLQWVDPVGRLICGSDILQSFEPKLKI